ncbi:MAG: hypothetical protein KRP56_00410 [Candidatus Methanogranum gryphiswaldense]|nr:MAG: hypothetical protein KRP56_00410 [Candidatus Methanogranum sp. U3.2.1]
MISLNIDNCKIDILPIIQGLTSEAEAVKQNYGNYEAYGIPLSIESIIALSKRDELSDDYEVSELDLVYADRLSVFGEVQFPCPAFCELVDLCKKDEKNVIPLDMDEDSFTDVYINTIKTTEFVKEHKVAKKGMRKKFNMSSPESFVKSWDAYINGVKGYRKVSEIREKYIAEQILDIPKYRRSILVVAEAERVDGILRHIEDLR